ncbi:hypothetical protein QCM11_16 [Bacillus phage QCM11]|uniref:Uncharacterized protein n=1 Tax=Bacillus phage QCM11 TaxID=1909400 RepID=A0A1I9S6N1_9CAUD|nr:host nuclease inhibitor [Bacillus phage QCM11]AOZ62225.1 hypothetical protein QCM11_16 [Bacillus phage QCM11]
MTICRGGRVMNFTGKKKKIYKFIKNGEIIAEGTIDEMSEQLGITKHSIWNKVSRSVNGRLKRVTYEMVEVSNSVNEYVLIINDKFIGKGSLKRLSEISHFSQEYLTKISNGNYIPKRIRIEMFKKVG